MTRPETYRTQIGEYRPLFITCLKRAGPDERCPAHGSSMRLMEAPNLRPEKDDTVYELKDGLLVFACPHCLHNEYALVQKWCDGGPSLPELVETALADHFDTFEPALEPVETPHLEVHNATRN